jgi:hypothetical protein
MQTMYEYVSPIDQWIRIIVGVMAGWEFMLQPQGHEWLLFFSAFFFLSGILGSCPLYTLIGAGTKYRAKTPDDGKQGVKGV